MCVLVCLFACLCSYWSICVLLTRRQRSLRRRSPKLMRSVCSIVFFLALLFLSRLCFLFCSSRSSFLSFYDCRPLTRPLHPPRARRLFQSRLSWTSHAQRWSVIADLLSSEALFMSLCFFLLYSFVFGFFRCCTLQPMLLLFQRSLTYSTQKQWNSCAGQTSMKRRWPTLSTALMLKKLSG